MKGLVDVLFITYAVLLLSSTPSVSGVETSACCNQDEQINLLQNNMQVMLQQSQILKNSLELLQQTIINQNKTIDQLKKNSNECKTTNTSTTIRDCSEIKKENPNAQSGVYMISLGLPTNTQFQAYCDMNTNGGGWTLFQRRSNKTESFYRSWADYAKGFGNPASSYWLGNDRLALMTASRQYRLRVELGDFSGNTAYAEYSLFGISNSTDKYRLSTLQYVSGTAGDSLTPHHKGQQFTTYDQDNDVYPGGNCATGTFSGWWFGHCLYSNLNGVINGTTFTTSTGFIQDITWNSWLPARPMKISEMKIRPVAF